MTGQVYSPRAGETTLSHRYRWKQGARSAKEIIGGVCISSRHCERKKEENELKFCLTFLPRNTSGDGGSYALAILQLCANSSPPSP